MKKVVLFLLINCLLVSSLLIGCNLSVQNSSSYDATQDLPDGMAVDDNAVSGDYVDGTTRVDNRLIDLSVELGKLSDDESRKELADSVLNELVETNLISDLSFDEETYSYSFVYVDTGNLGGIMLRESDSVDTISDNATSDDDIAPLHVIVDAYPYTTGMATIEYGEGKTTEYTPEPDMFLYFDDIFGSSIIVESVSGDEVVVRLVDFVCSNDSGAEKVRIAKGSTEIFTRGVNDGTEVHITVE